MYGGEWRGLLGPKRFKQDGLAWPKQFRPYGGPGAVQFVGGVVLTVTLGSGLLGVRDAPDDVGARWATCGRGLARCGCRPRSASAAVYVGLVLSLCWRPMVWISATLWSPVAPLAVFISTSLTVGG